jgi:hypothetical protein
VLLTLDLVRKCCGHLALFVPTAVRNCLGDIDVVCSAVARYALCNCLLIDLLDILS